MLPLKEATSEKHRLAERMPFNVKMFHGELSKAEYLNYLIQQLELFKTLESKSLIHPNLSRIQPLLFDIQELANQKIELPPVLNATKQYTAYLNTLNEKSILPHVYLHYMAIMFGGQMIKSKVPSSGKFYKFNEMSDCIQSIRNVQRDEWADEVNRGFDFTIQLFRELELPLEFENTSHSVQATI